MGHYPIPSIVRGIAEAEAVAPDELDVTLQRHVDTDAIQLLAAHERSSWTLSFELPNHRVTVTSDGAVLVDGDRTATWD